MILALLAPYAAAFCGTYVGPVGSALENQAAQVLIARDGERTVLTLANDYTGSEANFGLIIPVPEVLLDDDVSLPDPELIAAFDLYAAPRIVSYTCDDLHSRYDDADVDETSSGGSVADADGVVVESSFSAGEYDIVVLSATGAEGLVSWLDANGFVVDSSAEAVIQDYIDQDQYFLAARINLDAIPAGQSYLSPLQLRYESSSFGLPIRIGTTVSPGEQEVVIHFLTPSSDGKVGISNYPEGAIEDECMMPADVTDYNLFYEGQLAETFADAVWFTEYAWDLGSCDPCSAEAPEEDLLIEAGASWEDPFYDSYITRIKLRYTPEDATQDLVFYTSGLRDSSQVRYIEYVEDLESDFEVCGLGWVENPGECDNVDYEDPEDGGDGGDDDVSSDWPFAQGQPNAGKSDDEAGLCATSSPGPGFGLMLLSAAALRRRRK